jgi:hypothetical protein
MAFNIGVNARPEDFDFYGMTPGVGPKFNRLQGTGQVDQNALAMLQGLDRQNSNPFFDAFRQGYTLTPSATFGQVQAGGGATAGGDTGGITSGWADMGHTYRPQDFLAGRSTNFGDSPTSRFDDGMEMVNWYDNRGKNTYTDVINDPANLGKFTAGDLGLIVSGLGAMGGLAMLPGGALSGVFGSGGGVGSGAGFVGEGAASGIGAWDAALAGATPGQLGAVGSGAGFIGEGVSSGVPGWDSALSGAASGGATTTTGLGKLLGSIGGLKDWAPVLGAVLGGVAGSKGQEQSQTTTRELPEYLRGPVTGRNGLLSSADRLMQHQLYGTPMGLLK